MLIVNNVGDDADSHSFALLFTPSGLYIVGGRILVGIIGSFLLLYGFVRLVVLGTIEELSLHVSTEKMEK